jgi:cysteine desulfurase
MIYLDYQATTPLAPEAKAAMLPYLDQLFGNPHSLHRMGNAAHAAIKLAHDRVGALIDPKSRHGVASFTGNATESVNFAMKGLFLEGQRSHGWKGRRKLVTVETEHACVLDTASWLELQGVEVVRLPVGRDGLVDLAAAAEAVDEQTALVAIMLVNNEIGVIQPVAAVAELARAAGALVLCDAVQGYGRVPVPLDACDMVAVSAHKIFGPKGVGYLWKRDGIALTPLLHGGEQETGPRSGTLSPALCAGFGAAAELARSRQAADLMHVESLWDAALAALGPEWEINGSTEHRYRGNLNIRMPGLDASRLFEELRDLAFSLGSACASGSGRPSHVLRALGLSDQEARSSVRLGWGRYTKIEEVREAVGRIDEAARRIARQFA